MTATSAKHAPIGLGLKLVAVQKRFGQVAALAGIDWAIEPASCVGLVGSSASGKTTLLRIIAGLEQPDAGEVRFCDADGATLRRPTVGMVFQNLGLWPHLSARQHVACVLSSRSAAATVESLLEEVRLPRAAWDRRPSELSGGEGQRLALARALACQPSLLLLDEPLAHLDAALRMDLLTQLANVIRSRRMTAVFVTHAWQEAAAVCRRIGVLEKGRLEQTGSPEDLYWQPVNPTVGRLTGQVIQLPRTWLAEGRIAADANAPGWCGIAASSNAEIWLRPQQLKLIATKDANRWRVDGCRPLGAGWLIDLENDAQHHVTFPASTPAAPGDMIGLGLSALG